MITSSFLNEHWKMVIKKWDFVNNYLQSYFAIFCKKKKLKVVNRKAPAVMVAPTINFLKV